MSTPTTIERAVRIFRRYGGILQTREALAAGIHPRTLYTLRDQGTVDQLSRGLFRLAALPPLTAPDLITVHRRIPAGVLCLVSALDVHGLTTQVPHVVQVAVPQGTTPPRLDYPPIRIFWFRGRQYTDGITHCCYDGLSIPVYNPEKTLVDCFRYRHKIGMETVMEALKVYLQGTRQMDRLLSYAKNGRVARVMRPYLEALT